MAKQMISKSLGFFASTLRLKRRQTGEETDSVNNDHQLTGVGNESINDELESEDTHCVSDGLPLEDDLLYCKSNIYLRQSGCPGQLYIVTRGSVWGPTLLLNWVPGGDHAWTGAVTPFSTDLGQMEVIRIFCHVDSGRKEEPSGSEKERGGKEVPEKEHGRSEVTSGELVISSRENICAVFEFKKGSKVLELIKVLKGWKYFTYQRRDELIHTFSVYRPQLELSQLHPDEGTVKSVLTEDMLKTLTDADGRITDERFVRKVGCEEDS